MTYNLIDGFNGLLEMFGGFFILLSIFQLHKDKKVAGVSWIHVAFFTCWGAWNLYYYPSLGQTLSTIGAYFVFIANFIWLCQIMYYRNSVRRE